MSASLAMLSVVALSKDDAICSDEPSSAKPSKNGFTSDRLLQLPGARFRKMPFLMSLALIISAPPSSTMLMRASFTKYM